LTTTINVVNVNEAPTNTGVIGSTNLVSNGSFETDTTGWSISGVTDRLNTQGSTAGSFAFAMTAGSGAVDGVASTTLSTSVGQTYTVTFDMGAIGVTSGINVAQTMSFQVLGVSTLVNENIVDSSTSNNTFNSYRYTFVADSTTTTLRFADASSSTTNVATHAKRIVETKAKVAAWPKLFVNLRGSCSDDLERRGIPEKAINAWIGNSARMRRRHYHSVRPADWEAATGIPAPIPAPSGTVSGHQEPSSLLESREKPLDVREKAENQYPRQGSNLSGG
jgi:hypothetical protein